MYNGSVTCCERWLIRYEHNNPAFCIAAHWSINMLIFSCRIVSFTAWKTKFIFSVSTAVVKWWKSGLVRTILRSSKSANSNCWTCLRSCGLPANFGNVSFMLMRFTFSASRSVLLRKSMMETSTNVLLLTIASKMLHDSTRRFVLRSS